MSASQTHEAGPATMEAAVLEKFGAQLSVHSRPRPTAGPGTVLVRVAASGVNPLDTKIRVGSAAHAQVNPPAILGLDLAGVVGLGPDLGFVEHVGNEYRSVAPGRPDALRLGLGGVAPPAEDRDANPGFGEPGRHARAEDAVSPRDDGRLPCEPVGRRGHRALKDIG